MLDVVVTLNNYVLFLFSFLGLELYYGDIGKRKCKVFLCCTQWC